MNRIPITTAKKIAQDNRAAMVVIFAIGLDNTFAVTSYGMTRQLCRCAGAYADQIANHVLRGSISAPETEPLDMPDAPATFAGQRGTESP